MKDIRILLVDDDDLFRKSLAKELDRTGFSVRTAGKGEEALAAVKAHSHDVALLDIRLPDQDGLTVLRAIKRLDPTIEVIMLTAYGTVGTAVEALKAGAYHYLVKPAKLAEIDATVRKAYEKRTLALENQALREKLRRDGDGPRIIGDSQKMRDVMAVVRRVAPTAQTVLIQGESGTGKELIARQIHAWSPRAGRPFVLLDCASLSKSLLESELFGHEKGAFTGALERRQGLVEAADKGTLFVDEVGALAAELQSSFLRLMETREYRRIGSSEVRKSDLRIVAATNVNLAEAARKGEFREDLFYRLSVIEIAVPPLRDRKEDIPLLADYFLQRVSFEGAPRGISPPALQLLKQHHWPGNVRELKNAIERAALFADGESIEPGDLQILTSPADRLMRRLLPEDDLLPIRSIEARYVQLVLDKVDGNQQKAAKILGIDPKTLYRWLKKDAEPSQPSVSETEP